MVNILIDISCHEEMLFLEDMSTVIAFPCLKSFQVKNTSGGDNILEDYQLEKKLLLTIT